MGGKCKVIAKADKEDLRRWTFCSFLPFHACRLRIYIAPPFKIEVIDKISSMRRRLDLCPLD